MALKFLLNQFKAITGGLRPKHFNLVYKFVNSNELIVISPNKLNFY